MFSFQTKSLVVVIGIGIFAAILWPANTMESNKGEVLIIYANETALTEQQLQDWNTLEDWLTSSSRKETREIARQLKIDRVEFAAALERELLQIRSVLPKTRPGLTVVVFSNRLSRSGKYIIGQSGTPVWATRTFDPSPLDPKLVGHPQSSPATLAAVLKEVASKFDTAQHNFILLSKSHGNDKMAITPRVTLTPSETNRQELLALLDTHTLPSEFPDWYGRRVGVSKSEFFDIIRISGSRDGMYFSSVVMESCDSSLSEPDHSPLIPKNIGNVFVTVGHQTEYQNLDYQQLLNIFNQGNSFADALKNEIPKVFSMVERRGVRPHRILLWSLAGLLVFGTGYIRQFFMVQCPSSLLSNDLHRRS